MNYISFLRFLHTLLLCQFQALFRRTVFRHRKRSSTAYNCNFLSLCRRFCYNIQGNTDSPHHQSSVRHHYESVIRNFHSWCSCNHSTCYTELYNLHHLNLNALFLFRNIHILLFFPPNSGYSKFHRQSDLLCHPLNLLRIRSISIFLPFRFLLSIFFC